MDKYKASTTPSEYLNEYNGLYYLLRSFIKDNIDTIDIVRVTAVNEDNTIDVIPIVKNPDADGEPIEEAEIYGLRYFQWQYGENLIKATPVVNDIGIILACKKDISKLETGLVGSYRRYSAADSIYLGGIVGLGQEAKQTIEFADTGIIVTTDKDITLNCVNANVNSTATTRTTETADINASTSATITSPESSSIITFL